MWAAIGVHGGFHLTTMIITMVAQDHTGLQLGDGPALWLLSGLGWAVVAVVVLIMVHRRARPTTQGSMVAAPG